MRNTGREDAKVNAARKAAQAAQREAAKRQGEQQEQAAYAAGRGKRRI